MGRFKGGHELRVGTILVAVRVLRSSCRSKGIMSSVPWMVYSSVRFFFIFGPWSSRSQRMEEDNSLHGDVEKV